MANALCTKHPIAHLNHDILHSLPPICVRFALHAALSPVDHLPVGVIDEAVQAGEGVAVRVSDVLCLGVGLLKGCREVSSLHGTHQSKGRGDGQGEEKEDHAVTSW